jgi:hypothetical protein
MMEIYKVTFIIRDGKAEYPPMTKEITVKDQNGLNQGIFNYIWNNRSGYGVTKNFSVEIINSTFDSYTK